MAVEKCKGSRDLSPQEMGRFRLIESAFRDSCLKWGYREVRTPTLEYLHLFTAAGTLTPSRLGKVYSFLDWDGWSGERVVLRPDGTIPIARYYIETAQNKAADAAAPAKLFYVTNVFSFEETGKEAREKWQCGAELIGAGSTAADVELVMLATEALARLGLTDVELRLSHAGLVRAMLARFGLSPEEQARLFDQVLDGDAGALTRASPELAKVVGPLLARRGRSAGFLKNLAVLFNHDVPGLEAPLKDFTGFVEALDSLGAKYEIDIASGQGFEYYTGMMFRLRSCGELVAGGGRYDALVPLLGGPDVPASGFALYLDKLMEVVGGAAEAPGIVLVSTDAPSLKAAFDLAGKLRAAGFAAAVDLGGNAPEGARWRLARAGEAFVLSDLATHRTHRAATIDEVVAFLKG